MDAVCEPNRVDIFGLLNLGRKFRTSRRLRPQQRGGGDCHRTIVDRDTSLVSRHGTKGKRCETTWGQLSIRRTRVVLVSVTSPGGFPAMRREFAAAPTTPIQRGAGNSPRAPTCFLALTDRAMTGRDQSLPTNSGNG